MPKPLVNNKISYQNINGLVSLHDTYLNQGVRQSDSPTFANLNITGDSTIQGNLFVEGNTTILNTNVIEFEDNILLLNRSESGSGVTLNQSGLEINRGNLENYRMIYNELDDTFKVGVISNLQTVAVREDYPPDNGIMFWNESLKRLEAKTNISIDMLITSTTNATSATSGCMTFRGGIGISKDIWTNGRLYLGGSSFGNQSSIYTNISTDDLTISSKQNIMLAPDGNIKIPVNKSLIFGNDLLNIYTNSTTNNVSISPFGHIDFNLNVGKRIRIPNQIPITFATQDDQIYTDSSNNMNIESSQNINLKPGDNRKVNIPVNIGLTFYNNNQQISANLTNDLNIVAGNNITLTPGSQLNVVLPYDNGIKFGNSGNQRIYANSNNELQILASGDIYITPSSGNKVVIPANIPITFKDNSQYIVESSGNLLLSGLNGIRMLNKMTITNTDVASNITSASLVVFGGLSVVKNIISKGTVETAVDSTKGLLISNNNNQVICRVDTINKETILNSDVIISNTTNNTLNVNDSFIINGENSYLTNSLTNFNTNTTESTDLSTAALVVSGGVSIQKKLRVANVAHFSNTIDMSNTRIVNVQDPTLNQDVATKAYVDLAALRGLYTKESVQIATLEHGDLNTAYSPGTVIDGYTLQLNDRILIKNQNNPVENGFYVILSSGAPTRTPDLPIGDNAAGVFTFIQRGDLQGSTGWICNAYHGDDIVGTDPLTFVQFSGIGQLVVGPGLIKTLNQLDLSVDDTSIEIVSNDIRIKNTAVGTGLTGGSGSAIQTLSDQSHVTKVGTLNTGVWNASTISVQYGGTGTTKFTSGCILIGDNQNKINTDTSLFYDTVNKRLGLGTINPSYNVHIRSENSTKLFLDADSLGTAGNEKPEIILGYNNQQKAYIGLTRNNNEYGTNIYSNAFVLSNDNIMQLATNNQSRLTILSNGNIGINTSNPSSVLHISGSLKSSNITITDTTEAISSTEGGSLTSVGGIGIGKNLIVGGVAVFEDTTPSNSSFEASVIIQGGLSIQSNENAVGVGNGGGLTVVGGGSFGGDLYVGGSINGSGSSSSTYAYLTLTATDEAINYSTGSLVTFGGITTQLDTNSTSITDGGALLVRGGGSIGKDFYIGGNNSIEGELTVENKINYNGNCLFQILENIDNSNNEWKYFGIVNSSSISYCEIDFYNCINQNVESKPLGLKLVISINGSNCLAKHSYYGDDTSNNKMNVIIYKDSLDNFHLFVILKPNSKININVKSRIGDKFIIVSEGYSMSPNGSTSGYLPTWTNVYTTNIESNLNYAFGDVKVEGLNLNIADNFPVIGYNNSNTDSSRNLGVAFQRYQFSNDSGLGEVVSDDYILSDILPNQSSANNLQIKFSSSANSTNDYYIGYWIKIGSSNQVRRIVSYNGSQRVAEIDSPWTGSNPIMGDTVYFYNKSYTSVYYDKNDQSYKFVYNTRNLDNKAITSYDYADVHIKKLKLSDTTPSTNSSTGSIYTLGGISISNTTNSTSCSNGGSFTTLGGASIRKKLYVGDNIGLGETSFDPLESLHINQMSSTIRLENDSTTYSYIDFVKTGTNNRFGIVSDSVNNLFSMTANNSNNNPINSSKALTITESGYIGINTTTNINSPLTINTNSFISTNTDSGYIGLVSGVTNTNINGVGSRMIMYGNEASGSEGNIDIFSSTTGSISFYTDINGQDTKSLVINNNGDIHILNTLNSNNKTSGALVISGGVGIKCTENSSSITNGGALTIGGGASIKEDVFIGGDITIEGNLNANGAITSPSISFSNPINCSLTSYDNIKLVRISNEALLTFSIMITPTDESKNTQIEFSLPQRVSNFVKRTDLITSCYGYTDDDEIIPLFNIIGLGVKESSRGLIKFQSVSTGIHYITILCRYTIE